MLNEETLHSKCLVVVEVKVFLTQSVLLKGLDAKVIGA